MLYNLNLGRKTSLFDVKRRILSGVFQEKACFCKEKESGNGFFKKGPEGPELGDKQVEKKSKAALTRPKKLIRRTCPSFFPSKNRIFLGLSTAWSWFVNSWITQTRPAMRKTQYPYNVNWIQLVGGLFDEGTNNKGTAGARLQLIYNLYCVASVGAFISWRHAD